MYFLIQGGQIHSFFGFFSENTKKAFPIKYQKNMFFRIQETEGRGGW